VAVTPSAFYATESSAIEVRWARFPLGADFVFDVEVSRGDERYEMCLEGTSELAATWPGEAGSMRSELGFGMARRRSRGTVVRHDRRGGVMDLVLLSTIPSHRRP
jgi:hypothetical protein